MIASIFFTVPPVEFLKIQTARPRIGENRIGRRRVGEISKEDRAKYQALRGPQNNNKQADRYGRADSPNPTWPTAFAVELLGRASIAIPPGRPIWLITYSG